MEKNKYIKNINIENFLLDNKLFVIDLFESKLIECDGDVNFLISDEFNENSLDFNSLNQYLHENVIDDAKLIIERIIHEEIKTLSIGEQFILKKYFLFQYFNHANDDYNFSEWKRIIDELIEIDNFEDFTNVKETKLQEVVEKIISGVLLVVKTDETFFVNDIGYGDMVIKYDIPSETKEILSNINSSSLQVYNDSFYLHEYYLFPLSNHYALVLTSFLSNLFSSMNPQSENDRDSYEDKIIRGVFSALNGMKIKVASSSEGEKMAVTFENADTLPLPFITLDKDDTAYLNSFLLNQANRYVGIKDKDYLKDFIEQYNLQLNEEAMPLYSLDFLK